MQATTSVPTPNSAKARRKLSWFMFFPLIAAVSALILAAIFVISYQQKHVDRIFTGVMVSGIDLSGMSMAEAREMLRDLYPAPAEKTITLSYPAGDKSWTYSLEELGITLDDQTILETAMAVGRQGGPINRMIEQFQSWYYGHQVAPILIFDEGKVDLAINSIAAEINRPAADATLLFDGSEVGFATAQVGHQLELANTRERLLAAM